MEIKTKVVPGHPEFWDVGYETAPGFFEAVRTLEPILNEIFGAGPSEPLAKVCRHIAKTVCNSIGALIVLACNGYGNDAMKIARSMFEGAVTVGYLKKHPGELQDYMDFVWISNRKLIGFLEDHAPQLVKNIPHETLLESEKQYQSVVCRFTNSAGKVRTHWCRQPFRQMVADVGLADWYLSFYHLASAMHHVDMRGLTSQVERNEDPEVLDADVAPSGAWIEQALIAGHISVVFVLEHYVELSGLDKRPLVEKAIHELRTAWAPTPPTV